eukprot:4052827-Prymnesium_polylepis.1
MAGPRGGLFAHVGMVPEGTRPSQDEGPLQAFAPLDRRQRSSHSKGRLQCRPTPARRTLRDTQTSVQHGADFLSIRASV